MSELNMPEVSQHSLPAGRGKGGSFDAAPKIVRSKNPVRGALRIALFFALIGLVAFCLNATINHGLRRIKVSKFGSLNRVVSGQVNADIVISGSSRALCHYDPQIIQNLTGMTAYNIGMNASQIDFQLAVLKTYLKHNTKPRLVIQNLDLFSFETTKKGAIYDPGYYMPYLGENDIYDFMHGIDPDAWKWKYIPLYGYAVEDMRFTWVWGLLGCIGINGAEDYHLGFNPRPAKWNEDFARFKASNQSGVTYAIEPKGIQCLEELIQLCRQNDIRMLLVFSPEYSEMQTLEKNRPEIVGKFRMIADRYNVPYWDFSDSEVSSRSELFNNSQHLNYDGAELFSTEIGKRLAEDLSRNRLD